jgi:hypothetical protein
VLIVVAGDARLASGLFKRRFGVTSQVLFARSARKIRH